MITFILILKLTLIALISLIASSKNFRWLAIGTIPAFINTVMQIMGTSTTEITEIVRALFYVSVLIHIIINKKHKEDAKELLELLLKTKKGSK